MTDNIKLETVIKFLLGEGPLHGYHFSEKPEGAGNCWWRTHLREAVRLNAAPVPDEPNWSHPKIQGLIGSEARLRIAIDLVWKILEDPNQEFSAGDMEYWDTLHDDLKAALAAAPEPQVVPEPAYPTAWMAESGEVTKDAMQADRWARHGGKVVPLYAQPEQERKPLSEDAVDECYGNSDVIGYKAFVAGFRAAERHHHITRKESP